MDRRGVLLVFLTFLVLSSYIAGASEVGLDYIEKDFLEGSEKVEVVINYVGPFSKSLFKTNSLLGSSEKNYEIKKVSYLEYLELKNNNFIELEYLFGLKTLLQDSVPLIRANIGWNLESLGINLTGTDQSVCVIDTGVNYTHPDFGGCSAVGVGENCKVIAGYDFGNGDSDPMDFNGHGTHVAGIVGANGGILGVAPDVNIVAIKVFDDEGNGNSEGIKNGLEWCISNSQNFNISVISISLGLSFQDGSSVLYNSYCDNYQSWIKNYMVQAVNKNISVVVATGNDGNYSHISSPACLEDATPVTATYNKNQNEGLNYPKVPCTDKRPISNDTFACFANRWDNHSLKILAAPGAVINSTNYSDGNYKEMAGTSMSAPHVSGAIAIINQYLKSIEKTKTPSEIEDLLNATGKQIYDDKSDRNFSRIDLYSALMEIDETSPEVELIFPEDRTINKSENQTFKFNASDWQLKNATLYLWYENESLYNDSLSVGIEGIENTSEILFEGIGFGKYFWNVLVCDEKSNCAFAEGNYSLKISEFNISVSPEEESYTNKTENFFNCSVESISENELNRSHFSLWNSSGDLIKKESVEISGFENSSKFNYTFEKDGEYKWSCLVENNNSEFEEVNSSFFYYGVAPNINVSHEAGISKVNLKLNSSREINYSLKINSSEINNSLFNESWNIVVEGLSDSTNYLYNLTYCDRAGNCNETSGNFTTTEKKPVISSSGGGSSSRSVEIKFSEKEILEGKGRKISVGETINFVLDGKSHKVKLNKISNGFANITVSSTPINFLLGDGGEKKINLSNNENYNLFISAKNLEKNSANIHLQKIDEPIEVYKIDLYDEEERNLNEKQFVTMELDGVDEELVEKEINPDLYKIFIGFAVLIVISLIAMCLKKIISEAKRENIYS